jgi:hypothetical protein
MAMPVDAKVKTLNPGAFSYSQLFASPFGQPARSDVEVKVMERNGTHLI